jgi:hypothetical protein
MKNFRAVPGAEKLALAFLFELLAALLAGYELAQWARRGGYDFAVLVIVNSQYLNATRYLLWSGRRNGVGKSVGLLDVEFVNLATFERDKINWPARRNVAIDLKTPIHQPYDRQQFVAVALVFSLQSGVRTHQWAP